MEVSVIIPNFNGKKYLKDCLEALRKQSIRDFEIIIVDNGSKDGSVAFLQEYYPEVKLVCLDDNYGFCTAVNRGIQASKAPYAVLLNNDTTAEAGFLEEMLKAIKRSPKIFSCQAKMLKMHDPHYMDDGGNYYCALGWAYADGKGKDQNKYNRARRIFASCAGAAIYQKKILQQIGYFDERHFAYLEDIDLGYRARIHGYVNVYAPKAVVHHVGSGTTGSQYNDFKIRYSSRNSIYLVYKNMPFLQIILNLPFLCAGFLIKFLFFSKKGYMREYAAGIKNGISLSVSGKKVKFNPANMKNYVLIQLELWVNILRLPFK